MVNFYSAL